MKNVRIPFFAGLVFLLTMCSPVKQQQKKIIETDRRAQIIHAYALKKGYSTNYCFLMDLSIESGLKRFFVYDLNKNTVAFSGLAAHGSCDQDFLKEAKFSNAPGSNCTSLGIYKVGDPYIGNYGKSYKLHGLEQSNSNAFSRAIVLHSYSCVPDEEIYRKPLCNSAGCPMVSTGFFRQLSAIIDKSDKPFLLWVYNASSPVKRPSSPLLGKVK